MNPLRLLPLLAMVTAGAAWLAPAAAYQMTPMSLELGLSDRAATGTVRFVNDGGSPVAIQVRIARRDVGVDGVEILEPDSGDILVFPSQLVLQPGKSQAVRFTWKGATDVQSERSYRIVAEQLPVNLQRERTEAAQVDIMLRYLGTLYVAPLRAKAAVTVADAQMEKTGQDGGILRLTLKNLGTKHTILSAPSLQIQEGGRLRTLTSNQLEEMNGANMLAGRERRFAIPYAGPLPAGPVDVKFTFEATN